MASTVNPLLQSVELARDKFNHSIQVLSPALDSTTVVSVSGSSASGSLPSGTSIVRFASTANSACGVRAARASSMREAGFFMFTRFSISTLLSDMQIFVGMSAESNAIPGDPSTTMLSALGIGKDSADSVLQIISRTHNGTATKTATTYTPTAGDLLDFWMFAAPNGSDVSMRVVNHTTNTVVVDNVVVSATLPGSTVGLYTHVGARTVQAAAVAIDIGRIYVEQDI